jgi:hypothetical protein
LIFKGSNGPLPYPTEEGIKSAEQGIKSAEQEANTVSPKHLREGGGR